MKAFSNKLAELQSSLEKNQSALKHKAGRTLVSTLRYIFLIGMSFVMVYPVLFILSAAFKNIQDVYDPTVVWLPKNFSLQPLKLALEVLDFENSIMRTLSVTLPSVFLQLISSLLAGYGFARFRFRGRNILFALLIFTIIVPVQTYMIPLYVEFKNFDYFGIGSLIGLFTGKTLVKKPFVGSHRILKCCWIFVFRCNSIIWCQNCAPFTHLIVQSRKYVVSISYSSYISTSMKLKYNPVSIRIFLCLQKLHCKITHIYICHSKTVWYKPDRL